MTTFAWAGRTRNGQMVKGERAAESAEMLGEMLRREQILVTKVGPAARKEERYKRVSARSLAIFTRQFSVMVDAGLPLVQCLELLSKEEPDKRLAAAIDQVRTDVEAGSTLADAMQTRPYAFDQLFTNMVAAGEAGGILDTILQRLSTFIEKQAKLAAQVKSAMIYPISVLSIAAIIVTIIMVKVVPTFTELFRGLNATLPFATLAVIWVSNKTIIALPFMIAGLFGGAFLFRRYYATPAGRLRVDAALLRMPLVGVIFKKVAVARFCRTRSTLI
jgi:type IV pilus assembly protein PilC